MKNLKNIGLALVGALVMTSCGLFSGGGGGGHCPAYGTSLDQETIPQNDINSIEELRMKQNSRM